MAILCLRDLKAGWHLSGSEYAPSENCLGTCFEGQFRVPTVHLPDQKLHLHPSICAPTNPVDDFGTCWNLGTLTGDSVAELSSKVANRYMWLFNLNFSNKMEFKISIFSHVNFKYLITTYGYYVSATHAVSLVSIADISVGQCCSFSHLADFLGLSPPSTSLQSALYCNIFPQIGICALSRCLKLSCPCRGLLSVNLLFVLCPWSLQLELSNPLPCSINRCFNLHIYLKMKSIVNIQIHLFYRKIQNFPFFSKNWKMCQDTFCISLMGSEASLPFS